LESKSAWLANNDTYIIILICHLLQ
jgi:hypothetical protein